MATDPKQIPIPASTKKPATGPKEVWIDETDWHAESGQTVVFKNDHFYDCEIGEWAGKVFPFDVLNNKFKVPKKSGQSPGTTVCKLKALADNTYTYGVTEMKSTATTESAAAVIPMSSPKDVIIP